MIKRKWINALKRLSTGASPNVSSISCQVNYCVGNLKSCPRPYPTADHRLGITILSEKYSSFIWMCLIVMTHGEQFSMMISFWLILSFSSSEHLERSIECLLWVWNLRPKPRGQRKSCGTGINRFNIIWHRGLWYRGVLGTNVWNVSEIIFTNF